MIRPMFRVPKHRIFDFKTRYYNAEKEAFEERVIKAGAEGKEGRDEKHIRRNIKFSDRFNHTIEDKRFSAKIEHQKTMSRVRFLIILQILLIIVIFIIYKLF
jgi:flagellar biosynthesis/type III secretory pathway M-ring protein FliF/YscJ